MTTTTISAPVVTLNEREPKHRKEPRIYRNSVKVFIVLPAVPEEVADDGA